MPPPPSTAPLCRILHGLLRLELDVLQEKRQSREANKAEQKPRALSPRAKAKDPKRGSTTDNSPLNVQWESSGILYLSYSHLTPKDAVFQCCNHKQVNSACDMQSFT